MGVNWSKAPKWATEHGRVGLEEAWLCSDIYQLLSNGFQSPYGMEYTYSHSEFTDITQRPAVWCGDGMPPEDALCERLVSGDRWVETKILAQTSNLEVAYQDSDGYLGWSSLPQDFRPVGSIEQQKSQSARRLAISIIIDDCDLEELVLFRASPRHIAENIHDAGYRK